MVHPATKITVLSAINKINKFFCIDPAWEEESDKGSVSLRNGKEIPVIIFEIYGFGAI